MNYDVIPYKNINIDIEVRDLPLRDMISTTAKKQQRLQQQRRGRNEGEQKLHLLVRTRCRQQPRRRRQQQLRLAWEILAILPAYGQDPPTKTTTTARR